MAAGDGVLTPRHRFLQFEPSWFLNGQTTSLLASEAEKELVSEALGGMAGRCRRSGTRIGLERGLRLLLLKDCTA